MRSSSLVLALVVVFVASSLFLGHVSAQYSLCVTFATSTLFGTACYDPNDAASANLTLEPTFPQRQPPFVTLSSALSSNEVDVVSSSNRELLCASSTGLRPHFHCINLSAATLVAYTFDHPAYNAYPSLLVKAAMSSDGSALCAVHGFYTRTLLALPVDLVLVCPFTPNGPTLQTLSSIPLTLGRKSRSIALTMLNSSNQYPTLSLSSQPYPSSLSHL